MTFIEDIIFHGGRFDINEHISLQISLNIYHWTLQCEVFYFLHLSDQFISINICILMCSLVSNIYITLNNATKYPSGYQIIVVISINETNKCSHIKPQTHKSLTNLIPSKCIVYNSMWAEFSIVVLKVKVIYLIASWKPKYHAITAVPLKVKPVIVYI